MQCLSHSSGNEWQRRGTEGDFSIGDDSSRLNKLISTNALKAMMEGKDYGTIEKALSFVTDFVDRATGLVEQAPRTRLHTIYYDLLSSLAG